MTSGGRRLDRALFLSGSVGKGHDVLAEACMDALQPYEVHCKILDSMRLLGYRDVGSWIYRKIFECPALYDGFYFSQLRVDSRLARFVDKVAIDLMETRFRREVDRFAPDLVVAAFPTGAGVASRLRSQGYSFRTVVFITEQFAPRLWVQESADLFLVSSELAAASIHRFWPEAPVEVVVPPVRREFWAASDQAEARASLGVPEGAPCVLVMGGSWGIGPLDSVARELCDAGWWVLAVGGSNQALVRRLRILHASHPRLVPFGFTDRIPDLMSAADVVVTSPGDACREARVIGRSIMLLDVVPGHGRENLGHELELGSAAVSSPEPVLLRRALDSFLADPERSKPPVPPERGAAERQFIEALRGIGMDPK